MYSDRKEPATSNTSLEELLSMRNAESEAFKQTFKDDDIDAVNVITKVIVAFSEYYKNNRIRHQVQVRGKLGVQDQG